MNVTYWFVVSDEDSDLYGEKFFVEVNGEEDSILDTAWDIAVENFPDEELTCLGRVSEEFAELLGYDTY